MCVVKIAHPFRLLLKVEPCGFLLSVNNASVGIKKLVFVQAFFILVHCPVAHAHA